MTSDARDKHIPLEQSIKAEARRLGFVLAGVTSPDPPPHVGIFESWLASGRHGRMSYLEEQRAAACRTDPRQLLPECESILMLAAPYPKPPWFQESTSRSQSEARGRVAAYAWGDDYHEVLPRRMRALVKFIEARVGRKIPNRCFTDSAPVLERDLAQRAGLGWIGKNTCLINPRAGSYVLLAEIFLGLTLEPDAPFTTDHCGKCTRCLDACPTQCILPDRTLDARRCISYLTIELRGSIPLELRPAMGAWVFGCDICQTACPWNRFAPADGDPDFAGNGETSAPRLADELGLSEEEFGNRHGHSALTRARHTGYLRNLAVAAGNTAGTDILPVLNTAARNGGPAVQEHVAWAFQKISERETRNG